MPDEQTIGSPGHREPMTLHRFIATYRWEIWLFFGMPLIVGAVSFGTDWIVECGSNPCYFWDGFFGYHLPSLVLLAASYPFVRRQGRSFLTLLWTLELALRTIGILISATDWLLVPDAGERPLVMLLGTNGARGAVMLWFARQASRTSLSHAFLLIALSFADSSIGVSGDHVQRIALGFDPWFMPHIVAGYILVQIGMNVLALWAMVRCDPGGPSFRLRMAGWLVVVSLLKALGGWSISVTPAISILIGIQPHELGLYDFLWNAEFRRFLRVPVENFAKYSLPVLALIYFVRVRRRAYVAPDDLREHG